jgi:hypothetical protein
MDREKLEQLADQLHAEATPQDNRFAAIGMTLSAILNGYRVVALVWRESQQVGVVLYQEDDPFPDSFRFHVEAVSLTQSGSVSLGGRPGIDIDSEAFKTLPEALMSFRKQTLKTATKAELVRVLEASEHAD